MAPRRVGYISNDHWLIRYVTHLKYYTVHHLVRKLATELVLGSPSSGITNEKGRRRVDLHE